MHTYELDNIHTAGQPIPNCHFRLLLVAPAKGDFL